MHELMASMFLIVSEAVSTLRVSENNGNSVFVEMLRGRDGLPGRDGPQGPAGPPGPVGPPGPRSGGAIYTRWGKSSCPQVAGTELVYSGITGGSQEVEPTIFACLLNQNTVLLSDTDLDTLIPTPTAIPLMCMGQSIVFLFKGHMITTCLVQCAMCPLDQLR